MRANSIPPILLGSIGLIAFIFLSHERFLDGPSLRATIATLALITAAFGYGAKYFNRAQDFPAPSRIGLALTLGLVFLSLGTTALAFLNLLSVGSFLLVLLPGLIFALQYMGTQAKILFSAGDTKKPSATLLLQCILALALFVVLCPATLYPVWYDGLVYHLALPKHYWLHGGLTQAPHNFFSFFPQAIEMLYLLALGLGGELAPRLLNAFFGVLVLLLLWESAAGKTNPSSRYLPLFLIMGTPYWYICTQMVFIENALAALLVAGLFLIVETRNNHEQTDWVALGLILGTVAGSKYNAAALIAPLCLWLVFQLIKQKSRSGFIMFTLPLLLSASPWYLRNLFLTGNPAAPLFWGYPQWSANETQNYQAHLSRFGLSDGTFLEKTSGVFQALFSAETFQGLTLGQAPFLLLCLLLLFAKKVPWKKAQLYWLLALWGTILWTISSQQTRLLLPVEVLLIIATCKCFLTTEIPQRLKALTFALLSCIALYGFYSGFNACERGFSAWEAVLNMKSQDNYIRSHNPSFAIKQLTKRLPKNGQKTLLLGETRTYYMNRHFVPITGWNTNPLITYVAECAEPACIRKKLENHQIDSILHVPSEEERLVKDFNFYRDLNDSKIKLYKEFIHGLPALRKEPGGPALYFINENLAQAYKDLSEQI